MISLEPQAPVLPDGDYPFIDRLYPLAEMQMTEAPPDLEALFLSQSERSGTPILRDACVELICQSEFADARFLIWWPNGSERIHMLVPKSHVTGRA
jgi:hypothetical protein